MILAAIHRLKKSQEVCAGFAVCLHGVKDVFSVPKGIHGAGNRKGGGRELGAASVWCGEMVRASAPVSRTVIGVLKLERLVVCRSLA